jgi:hypothetical protein
MPGTHEFPCTFADLRYKIKDHDFGNAHCSRTDWVKSDDPAQWSIEADTNFTYIQEIRIWDKIPAD